MRVMIKLCATDIRSRLLQPTFLLSLLVIALATLFLFPALEANYSTLTINGYRGVYNAQWLGGALTLLTVLFIPLFAFYLVSSGISRDRDSGMGQLLASSPVSNTQYIMAKWFSNLFLSLVIVLVMCITALGFQLIYGVTSEFALSHYLLPQLLWTVPILSVVCALAVLFESLTWLKTELINVIYFFIWIACTVYLIENPYGVSEIITQMRADILQFDTAAQDSLQIGLGIGGNASLKSFIWSGLDYQQINFAYSLAFLAITFALLIAAIFCFDRFRETINTTDKKTAKIVDKFGEITGFIARIAQRIFGITNFGQLIYHEILILVNAMPSWWKLVLWCLVIAQCFAKQQVLFDNLIPSSWLMCGFALAAMGNQIRAYGTGDILHSSSASLLRQFSARFLAGVFVLLLTISGALFKLLFVGSIEAILSLLLSSFFIAALAILLGTLTNTKNAFGVIFIILWYAGPIQNNASLNFIGNGDISAMVEFITLALVFITTAFMWYLYRTVQRV